MWNCKIMDIHDINTVWIWYDTNRYVVCVRVINSSIRASQRTGGGKWHACSHSGESLRYFYDRLEVHPVELMDEVVREVTEVAAVEVTGGPSFVLENLIQGDGRRQRQTTAITFAAIEEKRLANMKHGSTHILQ